MVRLIGWKSLDVSHAEKRHAESLIDRRLRRMDQMLDGSIDASLHIKESSKSGFKHRYELHVTVVGDNHLFHASSSDWDLASTINHAFASLEHQAASKAWHGREQLAARLSHSPEPLLRL